MLYQRLAGLFAFIIFFVATTSPAHAENAWNSASSKSAALKWELSYLALSAIDTAQTIDCLNRGTCSEANPLFGKHPTPSKLIAAKLAAGALHFAVFTHTNARDSKTALRFAQISAGVQGGVVLLNARFMF